MKIVVVDNPKFWGFFLRKVFGIKKIPNDDVSTGSSRNRSQRSFRDE